MRWPGWKLHHYGIDRFAFYDLEKDIAETNNLAGQKPKVVSRHCKFFDMAIWHESSRLLAEPPVKIVMKQKAIILLLAVLLQGATALLAAPPNFVVIFIDDMGYGDIGPFGSKINRTPNLDLMAPEGRKLTAFYVASSVCTPSRAALMTGCYPQRVGLERGSGHIVLFPGDHHGLNPKEITLADTLMSAGYATGCFGKWHLGDQPQFMARAKTVEQAQVEEVDWSVGQILDTLRAERLDANTLVLFTSNNDPAARLSAGPLRGSKGDAFEGGQREPTIAWWPGTIPASTTSSELSTAMDLHPTFAGLAGAKMPTDRVIDGKDIAPWSLANPVRKRRMTAFSTSRAGASPPCARGTGSSSSRVSSTTWRPISAKRRTSPRPLARLSKSWRPCWLNSTRT